MHHAISISLQRDYQYGFGKLKLPVPSLPLLAHALPELVVHQEEFCDYCISLLTSEVLNSDTKLMGTILYKHAHHSM